MKIIKHGNTIKELTCPACGCIFQAVAIDVVWDGLTGKSFYAVCPKCEAECGEEAQNDGQN